MKIIVFGATGGTGKLIVSQALAKGHSVTAFVRNPEGLKQDPHLRVVQGDVLDFATVVDAVRGHRAVLSALGARTLKKTDVLSQALPNILEAMRQEYVTRLIVLGASGVHKDHGKYQNALTNIALWVAKKTMLKHPFVDQAAQERFWPQAMSTTRSCAPRGSLTDPSPAPTASCPTRFRPAHSPSPAPTWPILCCSSSPIRASIARVPTSGQARPKA